MALWSLEPSWLSYLGGSYESLVGSTQAQHEAIEPKIAHRDIKSSNILIDDDFDAKLSNFGLAKLLGAGKVILQPKLWIPLDGYLYQGVHPCDKRSINQYQCLFLAIDFSLAKSDEDTLWKANVRETKEEVAVRGMNFKKYLLTRRERERWLLLLIVDSCFIHYPHLVMTVTLQSRKKSLSSKFSCY
ncbi:unnamed protein product [Coffea canephora]|uniref:non-specific serine/threonine protein kinase n=1 Tax=Coffea canephora TaxID=49390 RepID=A0A068V4B7_COFCA|nr:unnamed protein product [Coffea canephora]